MKTPRHRLAKEQMRALLRRKARPGKAEDCNYTAGANGVVAAIMLLIPHLYAADSRALVFAWAPLAMGAAGAWWCKWRLWRWRKKWPARPERYLTVVYVVQAVAVGGFVAAVCATVVAITDLGELPWLAWLTALLAVVLMLTSVWYSVRGLLRIQEMIDGLGG